MEYGITPQGFVRKPYTVILDELSAAARSGEFFGEDFDLSDESPDGKDIKLKAWAIDRQWELAEEVYYALWLSSSEGVSLDRAVKFGFVSRQPSTFATVQVVFSGDAGSVIPIGTQIETSQNVVFETIEEKIVGLGGTVTASARCMSSGTIGLVQTGMINSIKTPVSGVDSVANPSPSAGGRGTETDPELRSRYSNLPTSTGSSVDAIYAALIDIDSVISVKVFENTSNAVDSNGIPPKCIEAVVSGGNETSIATMLLSKKPGGIDLFGSEDITIIDSQGIERTIRFSRPEDVNVYVIFDIETNNEWDADNAVLMERNAIQYIGGVDDLLQEYPGVGISKTVFAWKLEAVQYGITGIDSITVKIGTSPNPAQSENLTFLPRERAKTDATKITVNIL